MKKIIAFVFSFLLVVFTFCTPVYAVTYPNFLAIASEQGINSNDYAIFEDDNYYYYLDSPLYRVASDGTVLYKDPFLGGYTSYWTWRIDKKNPYSDWELHSIYGGGISDGLTPKLDRHSYLFSSFDLVSRDEPSTVVFTRTPFKKGTTSLSSMLPSVQLSNVLTECITLLPVLLPVLITFIAIRKGLAFILRMLRAA